jgi:hypothetical protein
MTNLRLKPKRGGFHRAFGCAWFVRELLAGHAPQGAPVINPEIGSPQSDIFREYKQALRRVLAMDEAIETETRIAKRAGRTIDPENINRLYQWHLVRIHYKTRGCRYHSFVVYFSNLQRLSWVEPSGYEETSEFQERYPDAPPRRYFRLTAKGITASDADWSDPRFTLYK